jgi:hypothetical protein
LEAWTLARRAGKLRSLIRAISPDLVHALRIPFEGMLAATAMSSRAGTAALTGKTTWAEAAAPAGTASPADMAMRRIPLAVSIWGNDLTLHAPTSPRLADLTRMTLQRADAVLADCRRDIRLSRDWGAPADRPSAVFPGGGGVRSAIFHPAETPPEPPLLIVQPRGQRAYVENETFLRAVPAVLESFPGVRFTCPGLAGSEALSALVNRLGIRQAVDLLPPVSQEQLAGIFRQSAIVLSPTTHDGTPNSLLEAMACGCFPVAGDLEPLREWIRPGENGVLVDAASPAAIAAGLIEAIEHDGLRRRARGINLDLISERGNYDRVMPEAAKFYADLV